MKKYQIVTWNKENGFDEKLNFDTIKQAKENINLYTDTEEELKLQDFLKDYKYYGIYPVKEYNLNNLPEKNKFVKELNQLTLEEDEE